MRGNPSVHFCDCDSWQILWLPIKMRVLHHGLQFIHETNPSVVRFLIDNIINDPGPVVRGDGEGRVSILPVLKTWKRLLTLHPNR